MDLSQVLDRVAVAAARVCSAEAAAVFVQQTSPDCLTVAAVVGAPFSVGAEVASPPPVPAEYTADLAVPLGPAADPLGILCVYASGRRVFTSEDEARLAAVAELGMAAAEAAQELAEMERIEESKSHFIHVATHELRSPIAVSQSLVRTVLKGYAGELSEQQEAIFARVASRLDFMESLVNDLLDLAASKAPDLGEEEAAVAVNASVGRAVLLLQPRAEEKGVTLSHRACCEELAVWASVEGLDRIFVNLVDNAIKYTPAGGTVTVSLGRANDHIQICVADTGIGIPADAIPHLFDEFYRAPNAKEFAVGTGLGLAIVEDLVAQYKGTIEVESTVGEGTTFTVTLPPYSPADE
ncbi:MAG: HAMP domain-containing sensor histidine kinase [Anaerolineae bacterium]